ncbi:PadR family transcriptional regulator [Paenarthrobacter ilicis]|uniref:DNA-binding PadR family transcriptional regulator n=1 Tax=Paenarthrobacter ilicis TaxID=43665 RepID=A0ABX0TFE3_9MICC|nr:PadR family transcriptional regulator [Paenarthrobacter ilicis]MBM7792145.1 DNA-binding PadR family transcriptional regulator [Paenarthrobacter ilicis]NIJ01230.1 DNA-binding PadR family transcriptional regulator [Paenarthrobacter ilicis]
MSIRHSLLALLQDRPRYGYELRVEFQDRTGSAWPLNIGQVYTTLDRLERDGLVRKDGDDGGGHVVYSITDAGAEEVAAWFAGAVDRGTPPRNEIAIKLALAVSIPGISASEVIQAQREVSLRALQEHTQARKMVSAGQRPEDTAWLLVLDSLVFHAEAEVRWLDLCEARMVQAQGISGQS